MRPASSLVLPLLATFAACGGGASDALLSTIELSSPAGPDSGEPFLSSSAGAVYMSWLQRSEKGGHDLVFARYAEGGWSEPALVRSSDRFFVNWADFPSVTAGSDGALWAHWLERGEAGGYDYGVRIARSADGGATWSDPWTPHSDDTRTEHGFVSSVWVGDEGEMGFVWLDGRATPDGEPMTLYFRTLGATGLGESERLVDSSVCDCCQTDAVLTSAGPLVVYRDRTKDEIRDIYVTRLVGGEWTEGRPIHGDGWETDACPVNGPAAASAGDDIAVAWFTAAGGVPRVQLAFSSDAGVRFGEPIPVDDGNPAGRVDVVMLDDGSALVSWLERTGEDRAEVRVRRVDRDGRAGGYLTVSGSSSERASGFPRIASAGADRILVAWTDVSTPASEVHTAIVEVTP